MAPPSSADLHLGFFLGKKLEHHHSHSGFLLHPLSLSLSFSLSDLLSFLFFPLFFTSSFRLSLDPRCILLHLSFLRFPKFFFFFACLFPNKWLLFMYCTWTVTATFDQSSVNSASVHCSQTHKFHFLSIFSLKMGLTALFTHLKIILLQCFQFSIFSFSKISSIQTDP